MYHCIYTASMQNDERMYYAGAKTDMCCASRHMHPRHVYIARTHEQVNSGTRQSEPDEARFARASV
jgi:hypothetical protein